MGLTANQQTKKNKLNKFNHEKSNHFLIPFHRLKC